MDKCSRDCLSCANSMSIPEEETEKKNGDELFCIVKQKIVKPNGCCKEFN